MIKASFLFTWIACLITAFDLSAQQTVILNPVKDNTIYDTPGGNTSNGQGFFLFAGNNNSAEARRCLLEFDVAGNVPAGSSIQSATLTLAMTKTNAGPENVDLHRLTAAWGEGPSKASGSEGQGATALLNDATWLRGFSAIVSSAWSTPGGDFTSPASATVLVGGNGTYSWSSVQLTADVQAFLDTPAQNFGWIMIGNESAAQTAKRFGSKDGIAANVPVLSITYLLPCAAPTADSASLSVHTLCAGDSTTISVNGGALNDARYWALYRDGCGTTLLDTNHSGIFTVTPSSGTTYYIRGEGGCVTPGSCVSDSVTVVRIDDSVTVDMTAGTLTSNEANANTYQWIDCSDGNRPVAGATQRVFTPAQSSFYAVVITKNGCTDTSDCVFRDDLSLVRQTDEAVFSLYPNPAGATLHIRWNQTYRASGTLALRDLSGRLLIRESYRTTEENQWDISNLPAGYYLVEATQNGQVFRVPLLKR